jgi:hypothetical protein
MPPLDFDYEDDFNEIPDDYEDLMEDDEDHGDNEPLDIDSDDGYDPYAGGPDMDYLSEVGPGDFGDEY